MFTEEQKIRAIELYFKYGKKLAPVVRELGYPSKRNLRRWIRPWEAGGGAKESIRHKHCYSDEQKQVAVEHYLNHGCCLAFTSRALGYPCTDVLARWVNERYPDRRRIFTSKANPVAPFEPEVKRQAVMALCTRQVSASEIAGVLVSVVRYCINGKMKLSATVLTRLCVNITNLPWKQNAMRCGRKSPD